MFSITMISFRKNKTCPSSQELLTFQNGETSNDKNDVICEHLGVCEFCAAEVEFYAHYPQAEENVTVTEIPPPLFELAHALLSNEEKNVTLLNKLLEKDKFMFENA
jgi:hypothetical protein